MIFRLTVGTRLLVNDRRSPGNRHRDESVAVADSAIHGADAVCAAAGRRIRSRPPPAWAVYNGE
jgi:hypothetical protein